MLDLDPILFSFPAQSLQGKPGDCTLVRAGRQESRTGHPLQGVAQIGFFPTSQYRQCISVLYSPPPPRDWHWTVKYQDNSDVVCTLIFLKLASNFLSTLMSWWSIPSEGTARELARLSPSSGNRHRECRSMGRVLGSKLSILPIVLEMCSSCIL